MLASTRAEMTRNSSHRASIYGNDSLELVWENGQAIVQAGGSLSTPKKTPSSCIRYSTNPSRGEKAANNEDVSVAKSSRPSAFHSLLNFPVQKESSHRNPHQSSDPNPFQLDLLHSRSKACSTYNNLEDGRVKFCSPLKEWKLSERAQPATTWNGDNYLCTSSVPFKKPRIMDSSQIPTTNSPIHDLEKVNFSNGLRPSSVLAKSTNYQGSRNCETLQTTNNKISAQVDHETNATKFAKAATAADRSVVIDSCGGSRGNKGLKGEKPLISDASKPESSVARSAQELSPPHKECDKAVGHNSIALRAKRKADNSFCNDPFLEYSSVCSLGASNNTEICSRKQEVADDLAFLSDKDEEIEDDIVREKHGREGSRVKRSRNAETHNLCERRRDKINKKMRVLKELIPNCNKVDKASMLDDVIQYLKTLKLRLQIMSMGTGLCMPLMTMLSAAPYHMNMMNTPNLLPLLMGAGISFRPGTGIPSNLPQFSSIPPLPITDNRLRMFGLPNQMLSMPMSQAPFIPNMVGKPPSTQPLQPTCTATTTNCLAENLASTHSNSKGLSPSQ